MKSEIVLLNVLRNTDKGYLMLEFFINQKQQSKNYFGFQPIRTFSNNLNVFEDLSKLVGCEVVADFIERSNYNSPLEVKKVLNSISYKGNVINLFKPKD